MKRHDSEKTGRFLYIACSCCGGSCTVQARIDGAWKVVPCRVCKGFGQTLVPLDDDRRRGAA